MFKNREIQKDIEDIRKDMNAITMSIMELKARIDHSVADTRAKMDSIEKHITPMHNRLDNMHSDLSRISFNVQDAIKKSNNG